MSVKTFHLMDKNKNPVQCEAGDVLSHLDKGFFFSSTKDAKDFSDSQGIDFESLEDDISPDFADDDEEDSEEERINKAFVRKSPADDTDLNLDGMILEAIRAIVLSGDTDLLTSQGKPKVDAIQEKLPGYTITRDDRDRIFEQFSELSQE